MPRKLAEAAVRMRRASARLDVLPTAARRRGFADAEFLPDVVLGAQLISQSCRCISTVHSNTTRGQARHRVHGMVGLSSKAKTTCDHLSFRTTITCAHPPACCAAEHGARVAALALLRDGRLATACHDRQLRVWCLRTFKLLQAAPDASDTPLQARARVRAWSALRAHTDPVLLCLAGPLGVLLGSRERNTIPETALP